MRKILLLAIAGLPLVGLSQTTIISDNFESYTAGELLAANSDLWTTWSGGTTGEDSEVSNAYSTTGTNSVHVAGLAGGGPTDLVLPFTESYTSGVYDVSLKIYMASGKGGYFNIQETTTIGTGWMFGAYFNSTGGGYIGAGGTTVSVTYTTNAWNSVLVRANLDEDKGECYINSSLVYTWQWSLGENGAEGNNSLGGINIYAYGADGAVPDFYVDDVVLIKAASPAIITETFESYLSGAPLAANSALWTTWSGGTTGEDGNVSNAYSSSGVNSVRVTGSATDLVLPFPEDYTTGVYDFSLRMYMASGKGGYFNIQQSSVPGVDWMFEIYFDNAGGGYINAGGSSAATVSYTTGAWTDIKVKMDLISDLGELWINGNSVHIWQWSLGATGSGSVKAAGGVNIYSAAATGSTPDFYVDDVLLAESFGTNISSSGFNPDILIAPNPSDGQFSVAINDLPSGNYQLELLDMLGRLVHHENMKISGSFIKNFDTALPAGIYYVRFLDGTNATTKKIVVN